MTLVSVLPCKEGLVLMADRLGRWSNNQGTGDFCKLLPSQDNFTVVSAIHAGQASDENGNELFNAWKTVDSVLGLANLNSGIDFPALHEAIQNAISKVPWNTTSMVKAAFPTIPLLTICYFGGINLRQDT